MWKILHITTLVIFYGKSIQTKALSGSEVVQRSQSTVNVNTRLPSNIFTRKLSLTKPTFIMRSIHNEGMAMKKGVGSDTETDMTYLKTEPQNMNNIELAKNAVNSIQLKAVLGYLSVTVALAKMDKIGQYNDDLILVDLASTIAVGVASVIFVKAITRLSTNGILQARDSRKIIHMFSAPLFMVFWPIFSDVWGARLFAGMITFFQAIRLYLAGTKRGGTEGDELANAISRSGKSDEALEGPFIYTLVLFFTILVFWRDNLSGVIVLSTMAAGDGAADIFGRRFGKNNKWFFNKDKSIAGSLAFFAASTICSIGLAWWFNFTGIVTLASPLLPIAVNFAFISAICAVVELAPLGDDNWSVPISAALLSVILL